MDKEHIRVTPHDFKAVDPWAHRSTSMACATCMWFVEKIGQSTAIDKPFGRCRRHAPTMGGYPAVFGDDWCGDHKLDENKLLSSEGQMDLLKREFPETVR